MHLLHIYQSHPLTSTPLLKMKRTCYDDKEHSLLVDFPGAHQREKSASRKVAFSPTSTMQRYHQYGHDDVEQADDCDLWYKKSDYEAFRQNTKIEVAFARLQNETNDCNDVRSSRKVEVCVRGIEKSLCRNTLLNIMEQREMHKNHVLEEQAFQFYEGIQDPCALRSVSRVHSKHGRARAWMYAQCAL